jgi:glycosyltransferase involved in cell wall biosynthesis
MKILFIDLTTRLDSFRDLERQGRGGMVTSLLTLPKALCKLNNECYVLSDTKQGGRTNDGCTWLVEEDMGWIVKQKWDFLILNRQMYGEGFPEIRSKHRILWVHDMVHGGWVTNPQALKMLSGTVFMSHYSEDTWRAYYRDLPKRSFLIPNGVDKDLFYPEEKDFAVMIFFCAPNRGLSNLPVILNTVQEALGKRMLLLAFSNMGKMHPVENDDKFEGVYEEARSAGIDLRDPVPQPELAKFVRKACLTLKPNAYMETCSNSTLQSLAAGTPVITSPIGADVEWVTHRTNGMLTEHTFQDGPLFILEFCRHVVTVLKDKDFHEKLIRKAPQTDKLWTWEEIGSKWDKMLNIVY